MKNPTSLPKNADFRRVYRGRHSCGSTHLVLYALPNHMEETRVGITVSKKVGNSVVRHRLKRQLREIYRLSMERIPAGYDLVTVVREGSAGVSTAELRGEVHHLLRRQRLFL